MKFNFEIAPPDFWNMCFQYIQSYLGWKVKGQSRPYVVTKSDCLIRLNIWSTYEYYDFDFNILFKVSPI